jgi:hypothetical protein
MTDGDGVLRRMYGEHLPWLAVLSFALTFLLGLLLRAVRHAGERSLESTGSLIALAAGAAAGQLLAAAVVRRRLGPR